MTSHCEWVSHEKYWSAKRSQAGMSLPDLYACRHIALPSWGADDRECADNRPPFELLRGTTCPLVPSPSCSTPRLFREAAKEETHVPA